MLPTALFQLTLLPFLLTETTAASHARSPLDARIRNDHSGARRAHNARAITLEERLAKRASGKVVARAPADNVAGAAKQSCRVRGQAFTPSPISSRSASATGSAFSVSSASASTNSATTTSAAAVPAQSSSGAGIVNANVHGDVSVGGGQAWNAPSPAAPAAPSPTPQTQAPPPPSPASNNTHAGFTPNGIKAGLSAGDAYDYVKDHIGWWYDWSPNPSGHDGAPVAVPMLWGAGSMDGQDAARLAQFRGISHAPSYIIGPEEPDCHTYGSAGFDVGTGVALWEELMAPKGRAGSLLLSPSMCKQAHESGWLGPFGEQISRPWDITNVHINKNNAEGIKQVIDHYWNTYNKPIWVTEFACVNDVDGFTPCTNQQEINNFIYTAVGIFESDSRVAAYAFSNGAGLGDVWPMVVNGQFTESGRTYLAAISQYH